MNTYIMVMPVKMLYLATKSFVNALDNGQLNFNGYKIEQDNEDNIEYKHV